MLNDDMHAREEEILVYVQSLQLAVEFHIDMPTPIVILVGIFESEK